MHSVAVTDVDQDARKQLKLKSGIVQLKPDDHDDYEVFIQSTSATRGLKEGSK